MVRLKSEAWRRKQRLLLVFAEIGGSLANVTLVEDVLTLTLQINEQLPPAAKVEASDLVVQMAPCKGIAKARARARRIEVLRLDLEASLLLPTMR